ncbi:MAG TPA: DsbA family protein [Vicinamibacterales bacterium]|nr:DsbA family protein [Vicinamibacterales bacterium]
MRRPVKLLASALIVLASAGAAAQAPETPAGVVNGEVISYGQLFATQPPKSSGIGSTDRGRLEAMHKALDAIAEEKMIAAEAAKQQVTPQQIIDAEIESNVAIPSREEVSAYYDRNQARFTGPREQALAQARQQLIDSSRNRYRDVLLRRLKREYGFKSFLEPLRTELVTAGHPSRGPEGAPVTIVEFSDFECPFCGALFPTIKSLEKSYPDTVRVVYRQFPLTTIHPYAMKAAEASLCAHEQGRFWQMHDSLFGFQQDLTVASLKLRAMELGLNVEAFGSCLDSGRQAARIKQDMAEGARAGVSGTPTLFVNGRILLGNQPAELRALIEDELQRSAAKR